MNKKTKKRSKQETENKSQLRYKNQCKACMINFIISIIKVMIMKHTAFDFGLFLNELRPLFRFKFGLCESLEYQKMEIKMIKMKRKVMITPPPSALMFCYIFLLVIVFRFMLECSSLKKEIRLITFMEIATCVWQYI